MKRCPTCKKTFTDEHLSFCTDDGTPLLSLETPDPSEDEATVVRPSSGDNETGVPDASNASVPGNLPPYQPPGSYIPSQYSGQSNRRTWPWIIGILAVVLFVFAGLAITAAVLIPKSMFARKADSGNLNANSHGNDSNSNLNGGNSNQDSGSAAQNENSDNPDEEDNTTAPTDEAGVLQNLTDLEQEWTVANVNADKKKLNRILADDYVGTSADGRAQGKAEYLRTATRDTSIQKWHFEDLKLGLKGDRATLNGIIRLEIKDEAGENRDLAFRFTDKFVWRAGRWQATSSVVTPLKEGTAA